MLGGIIGGTAGEMAQMAGTSLVAAGNIATMGGQVRTLTTAFTAATGSVSLLSAAISAIPIVAVGAAVVGGVIKIKDEIDHLGTTMAQFSDDDVTKTTAAMQTLEREFGVNAETSGGLGDAYRNLQKRLEELNSRVDSQASLAQAATAATQDAGRAALIASEQTDNLVDTGYHLQSVLDLLSTTTTPEIIQAFMNAANGAGVLQGALFGIEAQANLTEAALRNAAAAAAFAGGTGPRFGRGASDDPTLQHGSQFRPTTVPRVSIPRAAARAAGSSASSAIQDAVNEAKRAIAGAKSAGDSYFDNLHDQQLRAARDAHDRANKEIAEARRASSQALAAERDRISATLAERRRLNAAPVTAAEAALQATQQGQQLRNLQEAVAQAQAGGDAKAIRDANEALQNFQAEQGLEQLRRQQAVNDQAAEAMAAAELKAAEEADARRQVELDAQQSAADATAAEREKAADERWIAERKKFDEHILALDATKKATLRLAQVEELRLLADELQRAKSDADPRAIVAAQGAYDAARKDAGHHAGGGWAGLRGPELSWLGEEGPEYVVPNRGLGAMGGVTIHPGAIVVNGAGNAEAVARSVMLQLKREVNRQQMALSAGTF